MKRLLAAALAGLAVAAAGATAAGAHEEIDPATVQVGIPMFLTFSAANEKTVDLTSIRLIAPKELEFGAATREPPGWSAAKSSAAITWTGTLKPNRFESWGFEIESPNQPGARTYTVNLTYADNSTENADVTLTVVPAATGAGGSEASAADDGEDGGGGKATVAIVVAVAALGLAAVALGVARKGAAGKPAAAGSGEKQDW